MNKIPTINLQVAPIQRRFAPGTITGGWDAFPERAKARRRKGETGLARNWGLKLMLIVIFFMGSFVSAQEMNSREYKLQLNQIRQSQNTVTTSKNYSFEPFESKGYIINTDTKSTPNSSISLSLSTSSIEMKKVHGNSLSGQLEVSIEGNGSDQYNVAIAKDSPLQTPDGKIIITDNFCFTSQCNPHQASLWDKEAAYGLGYTTVLSGARSDFKKDWFRPLPDLTNSSPTIFAQGELIRGKLYFKTVLNPSAFEQTFTTNVVVFAYPNL